MFDKNLMKLQGMGGIMGALVLFTLLQAGCIIGQTIGLSQVICTLWDGSGVASEFPSGSGAGVLSAGMNPIEAAAPSIVMFVVCFFLLQLVRFAQETMLDSFSLKRARELREEILFRTFDGTSFLTLRVGAARVAQVANDGIDEVQTYIRIIPSKIVGIAALSIPLLVCEFAFDWASGIILAVMFPVIIFFMVLLGRQARERSERQYASYTRLTNRFMDTLRGLPVLKAFGASDAEAENVYANSEGVRAATVRTLQTATLSSAVLDLCATFGVAAVAIMLAFRLMDGTLPLYTGLIALIMAPEYFAPIRAFASDYHASLDGKNSLSAVLEMIDAVDEEIESRAVDDGGAQGREVHAGVATTSSVEFRDIAYRYEGAGGIQGVSFTLGGCEKVGIIGKSGAGKSTLANLVAGFTAPTSGTVFVNCETADLTSEEWRRQVRYIPQNPTIFRATLADNISFYRPDASRERIEAAVDAVGLRDLVDELSDGLDTPVGEGARGLSGGQAHRVALARILLDTDACVLVFDEPTAHLDIETERDLKPAMLAAMQGKMVIFATHRLHWAADMDRVITLADGRIVSDRRSDAHRGGVSCSSDSAIEAASSDFEAGATTAAEELAQKSVPACHPERSEGSSRSGEPAICGATIPRNARNDRDATIGTATGESERANGSDDRGDESGLVASEPGTGIRFSAPSWLWGHLARYKRSVAVALALGLVAAGCSALLMFTSGYLISATALMGTALFSIMVPVAFVQLFGFGRPLARYLERLASHDWVLHVTSDLRLALYRDAERREGDPVQSRAMGEYLGLLSDDVAHLQNLYLRVVFPTCIAYLLAVGAALLFGFFSVLFALVMLLSFAVVTVVLPLACLFATRLTIHQAKSRKAEEYACLLDDMYGAVDWVLSGRGREAIGQHAADDARIRALEAKARLTQRIFSLIVTELLAIVLCVVIAWAGGRFCVADASVNWIAAFVLGFFPLIEPFVALVAAFPDSISHRDSLVRLDEHLAEESAGDAPHERAVAADAPHDRVASGDVLREWAATGDAPHEWGVAGDSAHAAPVCVHGDQVESETSGFELRDVTFTYPGAWRPAVNRLSLDVARGEAVAVLGRSGAGKSTFARLLSGSLVPDEGAIVFASLQEAEMRENVGRSRDVGFVGQAPYLFNRTLRDNLTLGVLKADDKRLTGILHDVGLGAKLDSLEDGLDTVIGETGVGFSGGEAHRIAIARVLVAEAPVVVVDEPFSALDLETERDLLEILLRVCKDRVLVVVTHHLANIDRFDRVVFIEDGRVDLDGAPAELVRTSTRFRDLLAFDGLS